MFSSRLSNAPCMREFRCRVPGPSTGLASSGGTCAAQRSILSRGQASSANLLDAADVRRVAVAQGDPTRYDAGLAQASTYATCLKRNGIIR